MHRYLYCKMDGSIGAIARYIATTTYTPQEEYQPSSESSSGRWCWPDVSSSRCSICILASASCSARLYYLQPYEIDKIAALKYLTRMSLAWHACYFFTSAGNKESVQDVAFKLHTLYLIKKN